LQGYTKTLKKGLKPPALAATKAGGVMASNARFPAAEGQIGSHLGRIEN